MALYTRRAPPVQSTGAGAPGLCYTRYNLVRSRLRATVVTVLLGGAAALGCGEPAQPGGAAGSGSATGSGSGSATDPGAIIEPLALRELGAAQLDTFLLGTRPGAAAYRTARAAEKRAAWPEVIDQARAARRADPTLIAAAWLEAAALARAGRLDEVLAPLEVAATGDWARWGERSLELDLLAPFRATPQGRAWIAAADGYRAEFARRLPRSFLLVADGDVFGHDVAGRWLRATALGGRVRGVLRRPDGRVAALLVAAAAPAKGVVVMTLDLTTAKLAERKQLAGHDTVRLRWRGATVDTAELELNSGPGGWKRLDGSAAAKAGTAFGPVLRLVDDRARLTRVPVAGVTADWDDAGLASAMRVSRSGRSISAPPGLYVAGDSVARSPDGARVVFAAVPLDPCPVAMPSDGLALPGPAWFVAEVTTGRVQQLVPWSAADQVDWLDDARLAFASDGAMRLLTVADGLATPMPSRAHITLVGRPPTPRCAAPVVAIDAPTVPLDAAPAVPDAEPNDDDVAEVPATGSAAPP